MSASPWALVLAEPVTSFPRPFMTASNACRATCAGSSFAMVPTLVSVMPARRKKSVSVGPGMKEVTVTPVSATSS
ncbi:hypothetical protein RKD42_007643 [Streptomyces ambofaciens]